MVSDSQVADLFAGVVNGGVKLDYLPVEESIGTVVWESERDRLAKKAAKKNAREGNRILAAAVSLVVAARAWLFGFVAPPLALSSLEKEQYFRNGMRMVI